MADEENTEEQEEEKKGGNQMLIIIIAVVVVLVLGGAGAFLFLGGGGDEHEEEEEVEEEIHYERVSFGEFIVNLSSSTNYLKIKLIIEFDPNLIHGGGNGEGGGHAYGGGATGGGEPAGPPGVLHEREAIIRDAIIAVLSSKTADEVLSPEGKEFLKEELIEAINEACELEEDAVVGVYFEEFLIQ